METIGSKRCSETSGCGKVKSFSEFGKNKTKKDGINSICKVCGAEKLLARTRTIEGKLKKIYDNQIESSKNRKHPKPTYIKKEFINMYKGNEDYLKLYHSWVESDYDKWLSPSFDRKDNSKGYDFDNLKCWCTWQENYDKQNIGTKENDSLNSSATWRNIDVNQIDINTGNIINTYYSAHEAARQIGQPQNYGNISKCCRGDQRTSCGFKWEYVKETQLEAS